MKSIILGSAMALAAMPALAHNEGAFATAAEHQMAHLHAIGGWEIVAAMLGLALAAASPAGRRTVASAMRAIAARRTR